jgi:hypothetical protein
LPQYFVALDMPASRTPSPFEPPTGLNVGETRTGRTLAVLPAQASRSFAGVTGAADDRTFVVSAVSLTGANATRAFIVSQTFYLLRLTPGDHDLVTLTKLRIPPTPNASKVDGIALSPDGTKFAVLYQAGRPNGGYPYTGPFVLNVYSVATGQLLHGWSGRDRYHGAYSFGLGDSLPDAHDTLSWTADGNRIAFAYRNSNNPDSSLYLRQLDLTRPGNDLFADSTVIVKIAVSTTNGRSRIWCTTLGITGDGKTAVCGAQLPKVPPVGDVLDALVRTDPWVGCAKPTDTSYPGFAEISLATDKLIRVPYQITPKCMGGGEADILWTSPSGNAMLGLLGYTDDPSMKTHAEVVLVDHGSVTRLSWPGAADRLLLKEVAF